MDQVVFTVIRKTLLHSFYGQRECVSALNWDNFGFGRNVRCVRLVAWNTEMGLMERVLGDSELVTRLEQPSRFLMARPLLPAASVCHCPDVLQLKFTLLK
jgi:hypothetical protein